MTTIEVPPPYEPCVRCEKGDTPTAFIMVGPAGAHVEILKRLGWSEADAIACLNLSLNSSDRPLEDIEADVDSGELAIRHLLCAACAADMQIDVGSSDSNDLPKLTLIPKGA